MEIQNICTILTLLFVVLVVKINHASLQGSTRYVVLLQPQFC